MRQGGDVDDGEDDLFGARRVGEREREEEKEKRLSLEEREREREREKTTKDFSKTKKKNRKIDGSIDRAVSPREAPCPRLLLLGNGWKQLSVPACIKIGSEKKRLRWFFRARFLDEMAPRKKKRGRCHRGGGLTFVLFFCSKLPAPQAALALFFPRFHRGSASLCALLLLNQKKRRRKSSSEQKLVSFFLLLLRTCSAVTKAGNWNLYTLKTALLNSVMQMEIAP